MPNLVEPNNLGDLLKYEAPQFYSRDLLTVANGQNLALGAVVGLKTSDGKARVLAPAANDGTEIAAGVLLMAAQPSGADAQALAVVRHAIVAETTLVWPAGITANQKTAALGQLKAIGILVRKGA
ncbi:MAG: head decoration protein [Magnetococcales bacterium]|nr:head decoration protein [Magnetococcales bacterium]